MRKQLQKIAKFFSLIALAAIINIAVSAFITMPSFAYTIPEDLRPINEPLDLSKDLGNTTAGTTSGTIILLQILAGGLLYFAAPIAIIIIVMTGSNMAMLGAEPEKIEEAKRSLTWSVLGLLIIIFSYSLVRIIIKIALQSAAS